MRLLFRKYNQDAPFLDKSSKKVICPQCGRKTFVNYLNPNGTPVADGVCGRCDRKDNCGWHYPPRDYYKDSGTIGGFTAESSKPRPVRPVVYQPEKPSTFKPSDMLRTLTGYEHNQLAIYLHKIFDNLVGAEAVDACLQRYAVGTAKDGKACYWQVDERGLIRSGKVMEYNPETGKRVHGTAFDALWAHSLMKREYPNFKLSQAYFGSHLVKEAERLADENNQRRRELNIAGDFEPPIWLFESEKAAVIVALYLTWGGATSTFIPMATGGCDGFNPTPEKMRDPYNKLQVLKNRKIVLFPDEGKFEDWRIKGERLSGFCKEIYISTIMERDMHPIPVDAEIKEGDAFDDIILQFIQQGRVEEIFNLPIYGWHGEWKIV